MDFTQFQFLDVNFENKTLVLSKPDHRILAVVDEDFEIPKELDSFKIKNIVRIENILSSYEPGEEGDRQIRNDTISTLFQWNERIDANVAVLGKTIVHIGKYTEFLEFEFSLPLELHSAIQVSNGAIETYTCKQKTRVDQSFLDIWVDLYES